MNRHMYTSLEHDRFWYNSALGQALMEEECAQLHEILPTLFGLHSLQLGTRFAPEHFSASSIKHHINMSVTNSHNENASLYSYAEAMPFATESVDLVVLPHVLEFSENPHAILREVDRCLIGDGHLLIFAFNPWSYWQPWRGLKRLGGGYPWRGHYYSSGRLHDWLALLGFEVSEKRNFFFRPPLNHPGILNKTTWLDTLASRYLPFLSAGYMILARKRTELVTPIRQPLRRSNLFGVGLSPP
ncbi:MAG: class I SAM-dependent methyltransferase [Gammaproteobacteria bacterium]|nr:class I SAM-dependent methyltransferase [Gammaproteobacteria bacterium]